MGFVSESGNFTCGVCVWIRLCKSVCVELLKKNGNCPIPCVDELGRTGILDCLSWIWVHWVWLILILGPSEFATKAIGVTGLCDPPCELWIWLAILFDSYYFMTIRFLCMSQEVGYIQSENGMWQEFTSADSLHNRFTTE